MPGSKAGLFGLEWIGGEEDDLKVNNEKPQINLPLQKNKKDDQKK